MSINHKLRRILWRAGYDVTRFTPERHPLARRKSILEAYKVDTVLDIGANVGQFAQQLRGDLGYVNRIVSFEPLSSAFQLLKANAIDDPRWEVYNFALGDTEEQREINIAGNSASSSMLGMLPLHLEAAPHSKYIGSEVVELKRLDTIFDNFCHATNIVYMKIDTQGFESKVLRGAENCLQHIGTVQLEMSLVPLYDGEVPFDEMCTLMSANGYSLIALETGLSDGAFGRLLQLDGVFHRFDG